MNFLFLIDNLGSGGAQRQVATLASLLQERGNRVTVVTYFKQDFFTSKLEERNISIVCIDRSNYITRTLAVRKYIRKGNFDAVISFLDNPDFMNCFAALGGKKWKVITSERSAKEESFFNKKHKFIAWFKRFSDAIVCNSENAKKLWIKYYPEYNSKLKVIYNAVTVRALDKQYIPKANGKTHFVVAASFQYLKNPLNVIIAINQLGELRNKMQLDWYGNNKYGEEVIQCYNECQKMIEEFGLQNIVKLHGPTSIITEIMQQADCVGLFSRLEGLPNAICEAMTLSKPVIMSRVSDYNKIVSPDNGFLCDWDNVDSIANAFRCMIQKNESELLEMGRVSRQKSEQLFLPDKVCEQWLNILSNQ